jgi:hypothetical protein
MIDTLCSDDTGGSLQMEMRDVVAVITCARGIIMALTITPTTPNARE